MAQGVRLEADPPAYVRPLSEWGIEGLTWLDFGLQHRTRYELRSDDYRQAELRQDDPFLMRTLGYLGIREVLDPLRFGFEFMDARQFDSEFPDTNRDVNEHDILQAFGELYFADALGPRQPLRVQAGRMTFDYMDRRLVARNRWRNTINAFDGFRVRMGEPSSDWSLDVFAAQPVARATVKFDHPDEERWFYGVIGAWRKWSHVITLEPYYLVLDEDRKRTGTDREIHTLGLRVFGPIGKTGFDYDINNAFQFGHDGHRDHRAYAMWGEIGYTIDHAWQPRIAIQAAYATGDRDPADRQTERFDRLFGAGHSWSMTDFFIWQNVINAKLRLQARPHEKLRVEASYGGHWLASDSDVWGQTGRRDPTGRSGDWIGQGIELLVRCEVTEWAELEAGYAHFIPGTFVENTGPADDSDFLYVALNFSLR